jgi:DNA-binding transcriptional regulator YhcF (GntR family)
MNVNRLQRWDRLKNYKEELLSVEKMAERESKASRTIKKDFQDMKKVGYIQ